MYTVRVTAPADAAPGSYAFRLDMIGDDNPDEAYTEGPSMAVTLAPALVAKKKPPFWLWITIAAVVLLIGGIATTVTLSHRGQAPTPMPDAAPPAVLGIAFAPVNKNNVRITFTLNEVGTARVRYGTSADLASGTTVDTASGEGNTFQATLGVNRDTPYYYQVTATDIAGNTGRTLVNQFRLNRTLIITLVSLTISEASSGTALLCPKTQTFPETLDYATSPSAKKTFTTTQTYERGSRVPSQYVINHTETLDEDPARQISFTLDVGDSGAPCLFVPISASVTRIAATLTPANDWGLGLPPQTVMSGILKMTYTVTDSLTVI